MERPGDPPRRGPDGGDPAHPPARPRARSLTTRAQAHTATHPRSRGKGGRSRRVSGRAPCHGKAGVLRAGGVAGSLWARAARASQDPQATAGMGPRRLPRAPGATHGPHTEEARTTAAILLRRHAGRRHGSAGRTTHTKRQKAQRKDPPSGAHKCNVSQNKGQGRRLAPPALLWYHVIADNRIPQH